MSPCELLAQHMFVCMEPPWAQRALQTGVVGGGGSGGEPAAEAGDRKGSAVSRPASRTVPRGTLMFLLASKGKQMENECWHQAWSTGAKTSSYWTLNSNWVFVQHLCATWSMVRRHFGATLISLLATGHTLPFVSFQLYLALDQRLFEITSASSRVCKTFLPLMVSFFPWLTHEWFFSSFFLQCGQHVSGFLWCAAHPEFTSKTKLVYQALSCRLLPHGRQMTCPTFDLLVNRMYNHTFPLGQWEQYQGIDSVTYQN